MRKRKGGYPSVQRHISCIRSLFTSFPSSIYILNSGKLGRAGSPWMVQKKKRKSFISSSAELCYTMPGNHLCFFFPQFQCATGFIIYTCTCTLVEDWARAPPVGFLFFRCQIRSMVFVREEEENRLMFYLRPSGKRYTVKTLFCLITTNHRHSCLFKIHRKNIALDNFFAFEICPPFLVCFFFLNGFAGISWMIHDRLGMKVI